MRRIRFNRHRLLKFIPKGTGLNENGKGILFAALLKLLMPVIVMLPGIAAYVLHKNGHLNHLVGLTQSMLT